MPESGSAATSNRITVSGKLDSASVPDRLRRSGDWFASAGETVIDLAGVERADSAGVALLLDWVRDARAAGTTLAFANAPPQMRAIIDFCALNDVIPLRGNSA